MMSSSLGDAAPPPTDTTTIDVFSEDVFSAGAQIHHTATHLHQHPVPSSLRPPPPISMSPTSKGRHSLYTRAEMLEENKRCSKDTLLHIIMEELSLLRWRLTPLMGFVAFGAFYNLDIPGAIGMGEGDTIQSRFIAAKHPHYFTDNASSLSLDTPTDAADIYSNAMNQQLYSMYYYPDIIVPLFSGILLDKIIGPRNAVVLFCSLVVVGSFLFAMGVWAVNFPVMVLGRFICGIASETTMILRSYFVSRFFKRGSDIRGVALAFGLAIATSRIGSLATFPLTVFMANTFGVNAACFTGFMFAVFSLAGGMVLNGYDVVAQAAGLVGPQAHLLARAKRRETMEHTRALSVLTRSASLPSTSIPTSPAISRRTSVVAIVRRRSVSAGNGILAVSATSSPSKLQVSMQKNQLTLQMTSMGSLPGTPRASALCSPSNPKSFVTPMAASMLVASPEGKRSLSTSKLSPHRPNLIASLFPTVAPTADGVGDTPVSIRRRRPVSLSASPLSPICKEPRVNKALSLVEVASELDDSGVFEDILAEGNSNSLFGKFTDAISTQLHPRQIFLLPSHYWFLCTGVAFFFPAIFAFFAFAKPFFEAKWGLSESEAVFAISCYQFASVIGCPIFGCLLDGVGRNSVVLVVGSGGAFLMHLLLSLTSTIPPAAILFLFGLCHGMFVGAFQPTMPLVVDGPLLGLGFGLIGCLECAGVAFAPLAIGILLDQATTAVTDETTGVHSTETSVEGYIRAEGVLLLSLAISVVSCSIFLVLDLKLLNGVVFAKPPERVEIFRRRDIAQAEAEANLRDAIEQKIRDAADNLIVAWEIESIETNDGNDESRGDLGEWDHVFGGGEIVTALIQYSVESPRNVLCELEELPTDHITIATTANPM